jgi:hypothetical protein
MLPGISGRQIAGVAALLGSDTVRLLLNGDPNLALTNGRIVSTPGLTVGARDWTLTAQGDPSAMSGLTLIVLYRAVP